MCEIQARLVPVSGHGRDFGEGSREVSEMPRSRGLFRKTIYGALIETESLTSNRSSGYDERLRRRPIQKHMFLRPGHFLRHVTRAAGALDPPPRGPPHKITTHPSAAAQDRKCFVKERKYLVTLCIEFWGFNQICFLRFRASAFSLITISFTSSL